MEHSVAIGTDGNEVAHWVDLVRRAELGNGHYVVNVDEVFAKRSIDLLETESADRAGVALGFKAQFAVSRVPLVFVSQNTLRTSFLGSLD